MTYTNEQVKAAYALNLCTVSVSQIVDYNDINIMEQEYEAILNNLNLEEMPKDEALLSILKQILDTITFFRIQEKEKVMLDKAYQQKMKNAIWSAVPNVGLLLTGGTPLTVGISLATQVGMGYMNYRKEKANIKSEDEEKRWELEKTALEMFNGLRRELFDTAWRLATVYNFPDELRLTERQIKQYNEILMDPDLIRRYARLDVIKNEFVAYPPFWYYFGNTANLISKNETHLADETRLYYKDSAISHFKQYRETNKKGLLREDSVSASCALELIDLVDFETNKELVLELTDEAIKYSGRANDVLQISSVNYLRLKEFDLASSVLSQLVNEQYNTIMNAQLLSSLYVSKYMESSSSQALAKYDILQLQVGPEYLYPLIEDKSMSKEEVERSFISSQKNNLKAKYLIIMDKFTMKYEVRFGRIIPVYDSEELSIEPYFDGSELAFQNRKYQADKIFSKKSSANEYRELLREANIKFEILDLLNEMFEACCSLEFMTEEAKEKLSILIMNSIIENKDKLNDIDQRLESNEFDLFDMEKLLNITLLTFAENFFNEMALIIDGYVESRDEMQDFGLAEQNLSEFCVEQKLPDPSMIFLKSQDRKSESKFITTKRFSVELLGDKIQVEQEDSSYVNRMINAIENSTIRILQTSSDTKIHLMGDPRIARYFRANNKLKGDGKLMSETIAIMDCKNPKNDLDLIFTVCGVIPVRNGSPKEAIAYKDVKWSTGATKYLVIGSRFEIEEINDDALSELLKTLSSYAKEMPVNDSSFKFSNIGIPFFK